MIVLNKATKANVESLIIKPVHGVALLGPEGSGKYFLAKYIASKILEVDLNDLPKYSSIKIIQPEKNFITIDAIRSLHKFLQLKTPGKKQIRRIAIIHDAHLMNLEAQNALLKSLEEPPEDTVIILTALDTRDLKDTIYSRLQKIHVLPITESTATAGFGNRFGAESVAKKYLMSGGRAGLLHSLLEQEDHPLVNEIQTAKKILSSDNYQKLQYVDEYAKDKDRVGLLLQALSIISTTALRQSISKQSDSQSARWLSNVKSVNLTESALQHNPNYKLLLTNLMMNL